MINSNDILAELLILANERNEQHKSVAHMVAIIFNADYDAQQAIDQHIAKHVKDNNEGYFKLAEIGIKCREASRQVAELIQAPIANS